MVWFGLVWFGLVRFDLVVSLLAWFGALICSEGNNPVVTKYAREENTNTHAHISFLISGEHGAYAERDPTDPKPYPGSSSTSPLQQFNPPKESALVIVHTTAVHYVVRGLIPFRPGFDYKIQTHSRWVREWVGGSVGRVGG